MESIAHDLTTTGASPVHDTNAAQATAWDGDEGAYWAEHHALFEASLASYQAAFLDAAGIRPDDRVLDVGCGTGVSSRAAALLATGGEVLGVDLSSAMVRRARELAATAGLSNISFLRADAQVHPFEPGAFDIAVSRTGAMFFGDPQAAFANLRRSLRDDGRLVLLTWQPAELQEWAATFATALTGRTPPAPAPDAPGPFSLSDPARVRSLLEGAGFADVACTPLHEPMAYGRSVDEAHAFLVGLLGWMVEGQGDEQRAASFEALRTALTAHATTDGVRFDSAAWLVTARCALR